MRKTLLSTLAVALLLGLSSRLPAQEAMKPVVVVSMGSYDEQLKDIEYIGELRNQPELAKTLEGLLGFFTQGQGLNGLDKTRPWGLAVLTDGATFPKAAFLPVTDTEKLLAALIAFVGEPKDVGDGVLEVELKNNGMPLFIKPQDGWAWIGQTAEELKQLPKNPLDLLSGLEKQYDIAVRANVQNVPEILRQFAINALTEGVNNNMKQEEGEDDATFEQRKLLAKAQLDNMVTVINELEQLTIGWTIDRTAKKTFFDFGMTAKEGSKMATQVANLKNVKSKLSGFFQPESPLSLSAASVYTEEEAEQASQSLESAEAGMMKNLEDSEEFDDEETKAQVKAIVADVFDILGGTLKSGKSDIAASIVGTGPYAIQGAAYLGDTSRVAPLVDKIVALLKSRERLVSFDKNAAQAGDVKFDRITLKPREGEEGEKVAKLLGTGNIEIYVGVSKDTVYAAGGFGALAVVKQAVETSKTAGETPATPLNFTASAGAIARIVSLVEDEEGKAGLIAEMLKEVGSDRIQVQYKPVTNGVIVRVEAQEGIIKMLGMLDPLVAPQVPGL